METVNRIIQNYSQAFQLDSMRIDLTGFSSDPPGDSIRLEFEISGLSPDGVPVRHRLYGSFEYPMNGLRDTWME